MIARPGVRMDLSEYYADFEKNFWAINELGFWKLERGQHFREPGHESWEAFDRGDWDEAMRLLDTRRPEMIDYQRHIADRGFIARRVRVVEEPITPYLRWELQALRIRDECGGPVRVIGPEQIAELEHDSPLPEIYTLGAKVMYEAVYDQNGVLEAACRTTDRGIVVRCQRLIQELFEMGEPLSSYLARAAGP